MDKKLIEDHFVLKALHFSRYLQLPPAVQSTSAVYLRKIYKQVDVYDCTLEENLSRVYAVVLLAAKSENFHSIHHYNSSEFNLPQIMEHELRCAELIGFDFHVPCPYLRTLGYLIILQTKGLLKIKNASRNKEISKNFTDSVVFFENVGGENDNGNQAPYEVDDIDYLWEKSCKNIDRLILLSEVEQLTGHEIALSGLELPLHIVDKVRDNVSMDRIRRNRERIVAYAFPTKEAIGEALKGLK